VAPVGYKHCAANAAVARWLFDDGQLSKGLQPLLASQVNDLVNETLALIISRCSYC
jgi:hypothetical protein